MEAQAKIILTIFLLAYVALIFLAIRWFHKPDDDTIEDSESRWMLDDFYYPKDPW